MATDGQAELQRLCTTTPEWLSAGDDNEGGIVLSTRARLARNLESHHFPMNAETSDRSALMERCWRALSELNVFEDALQLELDPLAIDDRKLLVERYLISPQLALMDGPRGVLVARGERLSVMVNEEDHLRIQVIASGLSSEEAWMGLDDVDDQVGGLLPYAYRSRYGYLTACPTNVGTALRISLLMHLPALSLTGEADTVLRAAAQVGMLVRGVHGEGSSVYGNIYQVSNQMTLGRSESDVVESVERVASQILRHERQARDTLWQEARQQMEDKVYRALGVLQNARLLNHRECLNLLSAVRLGVNMFVLSDVRISTLDELTILTQPAHLGRREGRELDTSERDILRADLARDRLGPSLGGN
jgi:protein arginine kinase